MDQATQQTIAALQNQVTALQQIVYMHKHLGSDFTQELPASTPIYSGYVIAGGTAGTLFPSGWTVGLNTATYTVTHNLGLAEYYVGVTSLSTSFPVSRVTKSTNSFSFLLTAFNGTNSIATDAVFIVST